MIKRYLVLAAALAFFPLSLVGMINEETRLYHYTIDNLINYGLNNKLITETEGKKITKIDKETAQKELSYELQTDFKDFITLNKKTLNTIIKLRSKDMKSFNELAEKLLPAFTKINPIEKKEEIEIKSINLSEEKEISFPKKETTKEKIKKIVTNNQLKLEIPKKTVSPEEKEKEQPVISKEEDDYSVMLNPNFTVIPNYFLKNIPVYSPDTRISKKKVEQKFIIKTVQKENLTITTKKEDSHKEYGLKKNNGFDKKPSTSKNEKDVIIGYGYNPETYRWIEPFEQESNILLAEKKVFDKKIN